MKNMTKWSEQTLTEQSFRYTENGKEVEKTQNVLDVCISGKQLFKQEFKDKSKGKNKLALEFDFIVLAGVPCPKGRFYELEYLIGERGLVFRALIQAVKAAEDIPLIIGTLKKANILPSGFNPRRAWLRADIDVVRVGTCTRDDDGGVSFFSGHKAAEDGTMDDGGKMSILEYVITYPEHGAFLEYYRGDCREVCVPDRCECEKIFICGENGNDPEFAERKAEDMARLNDLMDEVKEIINDYNLLHCLIIDSGDEEVGTRFSFDSNIGRDTMYKMLEAVYKDK